MATIPKAILDLLTNSKTAKFAESLKHSDLPTGWADDPEIVDLAAKAWQEAGTESPFFKAWFGKSKVLKGDGPRVMHHMTYADDLQAFDKARQNPGKYGRGFYFSEYPEPVYGNIDVPVYLKSENPAEVAANRKTKPNIKKLQEHGYTGVSIPELGYQTVFEPEQVKSVNNRGTFNPADPNIYRTLAPLGVGTAAMAAALLGDGSEAEAAPRFKGKTEGWLSLFSDPQPAKKNSDVSQVSPLVTGSKEARANAIAELKNLKRSDLENLLPEDLRAQGLSLKKIREIIVDKQIEQERQKLKDKWRETVRNDYVKAAAPRLQAYGLQGVTGVGAGTAALAASLLAGGDEAKAAAINAALSDPASREKAAAAGLPYDPPVEESAWSPADLLVAPVGAVGIPAKLLAMALDAPVTLGFDAGLSALGNLLGGGDRKKPGGW